MLNGPTATCLIDEGRLREALRAADVTVLLPVLFQLTGDRRWLSDRYRPGRMRGMLVDPTGGLDETVLEEIREAAHAELLRWAAGAAPAVPAPTGDLLRELMEFSTGDPVRGRYVEMHALDMGFSAEPPQPRVGDRRPDFTVVVIGAGLGGLYSAMRLQEAGIRHVVLEKADCAGGTWRDNRYPGAGVDVPSHLYSFSFFPKDWPAHFSKRDDVVSYIDDFIAEYDLLPRIRFGVEVTGADWDNESRIWTVHTREVDGTVGTVVGNAVISAVGIFGHPKEPEIPGRERFAGPVFHSARWPQDLDLTGKRLAVVGTGASAMQIVPAVVDTVGGLDIYQRSAQWVSPTPTYGDPINPDVRWLAATVPFYHRWMRFRLAWVFCDKLHPSLTMDPEWEDENSINEHNEKHRQFLLGYMRDKLADRPDLQAKALPSFPPYGKRMLLDNGWFDALTRPHTELITSGVRELTAHGIVDSEGVERPADVVVLSTGFEVQRYLLPMEIRGRSGKALREIWQDDDARAYLGITAPDFPNLFFVYGPNTNGSGGSYMLLAEAQIGYIMRLLTGMLTNDIDAVEPKRARFDDYNAEVDHAHESLIWQHPNLSTYYRNDRGRVVVNSPWTVLGYWERLRDGDLNDFLITEGRAAQAATLGSATS